MHPIHRHTDYLLGRRRLPAGAIPLAADLVGSALTCYTPATGRWIRWWPADALIETLPADTIRDITAHAADRLGGQAALADALGISLRTVQAWACARAQPSAATAHTLARLLAET